MVEHINVQRKANESLGGVFEVIAFGVDARPGLAHELGERLDGRLAGALCSIQAVKGATIGDGFDVAGRPARAPTTRSSSARSAASTARPTTPAASRAA